MSGLLNKAKQKVKSKVDRFRDRLGPPQPELSSSATSEQAPQPVSSDEGLDPVVSRSAAIGTMPPAISSSATAVVSSLFAHAVPNHALPSASAPAAHVSSAIYHSKELSAALATAELAMKELLAAERSGANLFLPLVNAIVTIVNLRDVFSVRSRFSSHFMLIACYRKLQPQLLGSSLSRGCSARSRSPPRRARLSSPAQTTSSINTCTSFLRKLLFFRCAIVAH